MEFEGGAIRVDLMDVAAARPRWERLEATGTMTPFQSFQWVSTLIATVGRARGVAAFVMIVHHMDSGDDLMLLPLVQRSVGPIRIVELPDFGLSDYCAPILAPEIAADSGKLAVLWKRVVEAVPGGDMLRLRKLPAQIGQFANPFLTIGQFRHDDMHSWCVTLPERWAEYEADILSRGARSLLRRGLRKLEATGPVEHIVARDDATVCAMFSVLCEQREARFSKLGRVDVLRDAACRDFYLRVLRTGLASGLASLTALRRGPDIVATLLGLHWRGTYFVLIPSMASDPALQKMRLGKLLFWSQMREMHRRGCRRFDFTIGNEPYKRDFGATANGMYETAIPLAIKGYPLVWSLKIKADLKRRQAFVPT